MLELDEKTWVFLNPHKEPVASLQEKYHQHSWLAPVSFQSELRCSSHCHHTGQKLPRAFSSAQALIISHSARLSLLQNFWKHWKLLFPTYNGMLQQTLTGGDSQLPITDSTFALLVVSFVVKYYIILKLADLFETIEVYVCFSSWGHLHVDDIQLQNSNQILKEELKFLLIRVLQMALLLFYICCIIFIVVFIAFNI